ncbi:hypothetical protein HNP84_000665 [Thermocatellispora tengchongensis]|uniref:Uncharacterized protein n=2 Tax=Thermocatellispora tengchongensis TaxID=1073253 RepID=A0A840P149_9ACTN|nr:hypothetical protein [Thermocatellispora tengchongensis]MBB5130977.1 hypothetical protein [Thermocatellispora tengchongensis]
MPGRADELPVGPAQFLQLVAVDFTGIYSVYLAAKDERLKMTRLSMSILSAPFAAAVALASAKVIDPASLTTWHTIPWYLFAIVLAFGLLGLVPYLRLIEAVAAHTRAARAINNFRLLYVARLRDQFADMEWSPNLPVDPRFPETYAPLAWPGVNVMILAVANGGYVACGVIGLSGATPNALLLLVIIGLVALVQYLVYYVRANVTRRRKVPSNPYRFENVET